MGVKKASKNTFVAGYERKWRDFWKNRKTEGAVKGDFSKKNLRGLSQKTSVEEISHTQNVLGGPKTFKKQM